MPNATRSQPLKLLAEVRQVLRLHHSSLHTERSSVACVAWIARDIRFHRMRSRDDLFPSAPAIEACLADLAVHGNVAAATQYHAMNALVRLYTRVLNQALWGSINAVRPDKKVNVPVAMTCADVARSPASPLPAKLL